MSRHRARETHDALLSRVIIHFQTITRDSANEFECKRQIQRGGLNVVSIKKQKVMAIMALFFLFSVYYRSANNSRIAINDYWSPS